jgi:GTPase SAR1 family protein
MYDVTDKPTFESLPVWLDEAREFGVTSSNCTLVVVGNKVDRYPRVVTEKQASDDDVFCNLSTLTLDLTLIDCLFTFNLLLRVHRLRKRITLGILRRVPKREPV